MNIWHGKKNKYILLILVILPSFFYLFYLNFVPKHDPGYYFDILKENELKKTDKSLSEEDLDDFKKCNMKSLCFRNLFEKFTVKNGGFGSLQRLASLNSYNGGQYSSMCHQSAHGIGHGQLKISNIGEALSLITSELYSYRLFCLDGYVHGIIEESAKSIKDENSLVETFSVVCDEKQNGGNFYLECLHGAGHAALIQLNYDLKQSLEICDKLSTIRSQVVSCYDGAFMQYKLDFKEDIANEINQSLKVKNQIVFETCENLDIKYRVWCYKSFPANFENIATIKGDYSKIIDYCNYISNSDYKLACIKTISRNSFLSARYENIYKLCQNNNFSNKQQIVCTAIIAKQFIYGLSLGKEPKMHVQLIDDICNTLPFWLGGKCKKMVMDPTFQVNYISEFELES
jgi:serine protease inhibitor ecotin